jgi:hypothetical protein
LLIFNGDILFYYKTPNENQLKFTKTHDNSRIFTKISKSIGKKFPQNAKNEMNN